MLDNYYMEENTVTHCTGGWLAQEPIWTFGENNVLHLQGFETGNVTDGVVALSRYTNYAFPGPIIRPTFIQLTG